MHGCVHVLSRPPVLHRLPSDVPLAKGIGRELTGVALLLGLDGVHVTEACGSGHDIGESEMRSGENVGEVC